MSICPAKTGLPERFPKPAECRLHHEKRMQVFRDRKRTEKFTSRKPAERAGRRTVMNREEMLTFLKNEARGIATMFGPNCETIVHDMTRPGIRFLPFSTARSRGARSARRRTSLATSAITTRAFIKTKTTSTSWCFPAMGGRSRARRSISSATTIILRWASIWTSRTWCAQGR